MNKSTSNRVIQAIVPTALTIIAIILFPIQPHVSFLLMTGAVAGICSREKGDEVSADEHYIPEVEDATADLRKLPIETLEGIGTVHGETLRNKGISTLQDLMTSRADEVAAFCDVSIDTAQRWIAMSRFCWMETVSEEDAEAIVYAGGIMDILELANADVENLFQKVDSSVKRGHIKMPEGYNISHEKVRFWIEEADSLLHDYPKE